MSINDIYLCYLVRYLQNIQKADELTSSQLVSDCFYCNLRQNTLFYVIICWGCVNDTQKVLLFVVPIRKFIYSLKCVLLIARLVQKYPHVYSEHTRYGIEISIMIKQYKLVVQKHYMRYHIFCFTLFKTRLRLIDNCHCSHPILFIDFWRQKMI